MATSTLPGPTRPSNGPPISALPAIPIAKTRKSTGGIPTYASNTAETPLPKSGLRAPSQASTPTNTTTLPKLRTMPGTNAAGKTIRKTISVTAFPHPPKSMRTASMPPSPLSGGQTPIGATDGSEDGAISTPMSARPGARRNKSLNPYSGSSTPTISETGYISGGLGARVSDGLLSMPSPPQSRSSSAQDSYSTSATNYEDQEGQSRGRQVSADMSVNRNSKIEGKGNVIVSVRVRPDAGSNDKSDGEWMVDGRRSLVAYKGKEGGDYYYGKSCCSFV